MIRPVTRQIWPVLAAVVVAFVLAVVDGPLGWSASTTYLVLAALVVALAPLGTFYALSGRVGTSPEARRDVPPAHLP